MNEKELGWREKQMTYESLRGENKTTEQQLTINVLVPHSCW